MFQAGFVRSIPMELSNEPSPIERINVANLNAGQNLDRIILYYELREISNVLGPPSQLIPSTSNQMVLENILDGIDIIEDDLWIQGNFVASSREHDNSEIIQAGYIKVGEIGSVVQRGHLVQVKNDLSWWTVVDLEGAFAKISCHHCDYIDTKATLVKLTDIVGRKTRKLQVLSTEGTSNSILAWSDSIEGFGNVLILDVRSNTSASVRRLSY